MRNPAAFLIAAQELANKYSLIREPTDPIPLKVLVKRMNREDLKFMALLSKRNLGRDSVEYKLIVERLEKKGIIR